MTAGQMEEMRNVDPREVDINTLTDISAIKISGKKGKEERIREYIRQIGNPYCYRDGDTVVKLSFSDTGRSIEDCLAAYLSGL